MPIPAPQGGESQADFIARCADAVAGEFEDRDQLIAVCGQTWRDARSANVQHVEVVANLTGPGRTEDFMGREHRVVDAVLLRGDLILHNNLGRTLLRAEDVTPEWAEEANGAPVVTDHPTRSGAAVSAREPETLNALGVGTLFRVKAENGDLKGQVFFDPARADAVPDLKAIFGKLERGEKVELSTGFPVRVTEEAGALNGKDFDVVIQPVGFDHLAVFAQQIGACSVTDGCGLAINHEGPCDVEDQLDEREKTWLSAITDAVKAALGRNTKDVSVPAGRAGDPSPTKEGDSMNRDQMIAALAEAGTDRAALEKLSECQLKALMTAGEEPPKSANKDEEGEGYAWDRARYWREKFEHLEATTATAVQNEEAERATMLDELLYNVDALPWTKQELLAKDIVELRKVYKAMTLRPDYSARGGPRVADNVGSFDFVKPIMTGHAGESVLDEKEAN